MSLQMAPTKEDLEDLSRFRLLLRIDYSDIVNFVFDYLKKKTGVMLFFWTVCLISLSLALVIRINIAPWYEPQKIFFHTIIGLVVFPLALIPVHELMHILPYLALGARRIRVGADFKQFIFYVTAHKHVTPAAGFRIVALFPFLVVTISLGAAVLLLPGLWKWSISLLIFVHSTMCAGDFAMLNFLHLHRQRKIFTIDDADAREACFYEEI